jgi:hypothetical protein
MRVKIMNAAGDIVAYGDGPLEVVLLNIPEGGSYEELNPADPFPPPPAESTSGTG